MIRSLLFALLLSATSLQAQKITLLHFSDYHSHARPFYSEGRRDQGGIARAVHYLRSARKAPRTFSFSGGDMMNKGAPAWSDKYGCIEWPWFDGLVDAMAFGNHDSDYGTAAFDRCRASIRYPILGANVVDSGGRRMFDVDGKPYLVIERDGVRVGVFSLAGSDFTALVRAENRPATGATFTDRIAAARDVVASLREREKVDLVVLIGHEHREEDELLAREVSGIDIIFGSHSHIKDDLRQIRGTSTWYVSPFQYLTYISRVEVTLKKGKVSSVRGGLVRVDRKRRGDRAVEKEVARLQRDLESDPQYAPLFQVIGRVPRALLLDDQLNVQTSLGQFVMEVVREAAHADVALSTTSSFRQPIAPGEITFEDLRATLPYPNKILVYELSAEELERLLELSRSKRGTDAYAQLSGVSIDTPVKDRAKIYRVATTDYLARVAPGYREFFAGRAAVDTGLEVREEVRRRLADGG
jgi:5'-nucleotidase